MERRYGEESFSDYFSWSNDFQNVDEVYDVLESMSGRLDIESLEDRGRLFQELNKSLNESLGREKTGGPQKYSDRGVNETVQISYIGDPQGFLGQGLNAPHQLQEPEAVERDSVVVYHYSTEQPMDVGFREVEVVGQLEAEEPVETLKQLLSGEEEEVEEKEPRRATAGLFSLFF